MSRKKIFFFFFFLIDSFPIRREVRKGRKREVLCVAVIGMWCYHILDPFSAEAGSFLVERLTPNPFHILNCSFNRSSLVC